MTVLVLRKENVTSFFSINIMSFQLFFVVVFLFLQHTETKQTCRLRESGKQPVPSASSSTYHRPYSIRPQMHNGLQALPSSEISWAYVTLYLCLSIPSTHEHGEWLVY